MAENSNHNRDKILNWIYWPTMTVGITTWLYAVFCYGLDWFGPIETATMPCRFEEAYITVYWHLAFAAAGPFLIVWASSHAVYKKDSEWWTRVSVALAATFVLLNTFGNKHIDYMTDRLEAARYKVEKLDPAVRLKLLEQCQNR